MTVTIGTAGVSDTLLEIDARSPHDHVMMIARMSKVKTTVTSGYDPDSPRISTESCGHVNTRTLAVRPVVRRRSRSGGVASNRRCVETLGNTIRRISERVRARTPFTRLSSAIDLLIVRTR